MPGDARFPGSTIFPVITPSKGAAIVVKEWAVLAWSRRPGRSRRRHGLQRPRGRAGDARFGAPQRRSGVIEFLRGGGSLGLQAGDAIVGGAREGQTRFRGQELGCGRPRPLFGGQGGCACGAGAGGEIVAVEHDERLAFADLIAWRHTDFAYRRQEARRDRGGGASLYARRPNRSLCRRRSSPPGGGDGDRLGCVGRSRGGGAAEHPASTVLIRSAAVTPAMLT
jgi:hypothetical protein